MIYRLYLLDFAADLIDVVSTSINWGIKVVIFTTAALLAVSLIGWLVHRS